MKLTAIAVALVLTGMLVAGGCTHKTESERTQEQANMMDHAAEMIADGEKEIEQGKADIARGQQMKLNGDVDGGEKLIARGRALEKSGNTKKNEGRRLKDIAD